MASAAELAILLTVEGADAVDKVVDGVSSKLGGFGKVAAAGVAGIAAAGAAAGAALVGVGVTFDDAMDGMRTATGKTGAELDALGASMKSVVGNVPNDITEVSKVMGELSSRTGQSGAELEALTTQVLQMANATGGDAAASVESLTRMLGDASVPAEKQAAALDMVFKASQQTGVGIDRLSGLMVSFGAPMRNLGMTMEESAALLGRFEKEGVNTELVMGALKAASAKWAAEGMAPAEGLKATIARIQELGPSAEATALSMETFGQKAGGDMVDTILGGKFAIDDLVSSIAGSSETVAKAAKDTEGFGEKWAMAKNKIMVAVEPMGTALLGIGTSIMDKLLPAVDAIGYAFSDFQDGDIVAVLNDLGLSMDAATKYGEPLQAMWEEIKTAFADAGGGIDGVVAVIDTLLEKLGLISAGDAGVAFQTIKEAIAGIDWVGIGEAVKTFAGYFMDGLGVVLPIIAGIFKDVLLPILTTVFGFLMDHKEVLAAVGIAFLALSGPIGAVVVAITAIGLIVPKIKEWWASVSADTTAAWDGIGAAISGAWESIKTGITDALAAIGDFFVAAWDGYVALIQAELDAIQAIIIGIWNLIPEDIRVRLELIGTLILAKWTEYKETITTALESVRVFISAKWDAIKEYLTAVLSTIGRVVADAWDAVRTTIADALAMVKETVDSVWTWIGDFIYGILGKIDTIVRDTLDAIEEKTGISMGAVRDTFDNVLTVVYDLVDAFIAMFKGDWDGMWEAIKRAADNAWTAIKEYFTAGWQAIKDLLKIDELVAIFDSVTGKLGAAVGRIVDGLKAAFSNAWESFKVWVHDKVAGFLDGIIGGLIGGKGGGSTPAPGGPGGANAFRPNGMRMPGDAFNKSLGETIGAAAGKAMATIVAPLLLQGRTDGGALIEGKMYGDWGANARAANGRMGLQKGSGIADKPDDNGVRADAFRSGRGGLLAASSSNYWQVFVQRFGVPTEASARKVSKQLGIPLPKWLEDIFHPPAGETVNAPDPLKDPAPAVEAGAALNQLAKAAGEAAGVISKMASVGIDLDALRGSVFKLGQNFDDLIPIIGGLVRSLPPGSGGPGGPITIPGPGGTTLGGGGGYGPGTVTLMSQSATLAGPVNVGFTGTFQVASGRSLAVELVDATITDTPSLDKLIRAMDQRKAQKGP